MYVGLVRDKYSECIIYKVDDRGRRGRGHKYKSKSSLEISLSLLFVLTLDAIMKGEGKEAPRMTRYGVKNILEP